MTDIRRVVSVAEVRIPPMRGDEDGRRWRGVLFDDDTFSYYIGDEYADIAFEDWELIDNEAISLEIKICLEYLCSFIALKETTGGLIL